MKVLVVDDNLEITSMLTDFLVLSGIDIEVCNDGREGLAEILKGDYDKVLLDLAMPGFSGIDVMDDLKKENFQNFSKIIIFTASSVGEAEIQKILAKGVHSCVRKPVKMPELIERLKA